MAQSSNLNVLDFEKPVQELEERIESIRRLADEQGKDKSQEIAELEASRDRIMRQVFAKLTPWDQTLLARHPKRPYTLDFVRLMFEDYTELHGDRLYADDKAMIGGIGTIGGHQVVFVGHQKGRDLKDRQYRNFGSAKPEGYRKALRLMKFAEKFGRPIIAFVDTPAADCSVGAEERGISEAIARNLMEMSTLKVPVIVALLGEGGSGGAIGIGVGNRILMLEHAVYSVIPPEGCAAILWRDPTKGSEAAAALKITSKDALSFGVIDEIVPEPLGGAHRNVDETAKSLKSALLRNLHELSGIPGEELAQDRYEKFRQMGKFTVEARECEELSAG